MIHFPMIIQHLNLMGQEFPLFIKNIYNTINN
uniref:Uncharacterized protein n=1 Tax=Anguilla anguilla TaxID=7936 RepID=A0A0E9PWK7_ANGAN